MVKFVANFLFVLILFVLATALPLSMDIFSINLSPTIIEDQDEATPPSAIRPNYTLSGEDLSLFAHTFDFIIKSSTGQFEPDYLDAFALTVKGNKGLEKAVFLKDLPAPTPMGDERHFSIPVQALIEGEPEDYYTISLDEASLFTVVSNHKRNHTYVAQAASPNRERVLQLLYFPSQDLTENIPVTRYIQIQNNRLRSAYNALVSGAPSGVGLYETGAPIPMSPNLRLSGGTVNVYWYASQLEGFELDLAATCQAIADSLLTLSFVDAVTFFYNDSQSSDFGGIDWTIVYRESKSPKAYLSTVSGTHLFLKPIAIENTNDATLEAQVQGLWKTLTFSNPLITIHPNWEQVIPPHLNLNGFKLDGKVLTLDFNPVLESYYEGNATYSEHMIDVLVHTFASIEGVDQVKFTIDGGAPSTERLQNPLSPNSIINFIP